jgi:hypothetical protein
MMVFCRLKFSILNIELGQRLLMRRHHLSQAVETEIIAGHLARLHRGAKALLIVAAMNPAGFQAVPVGGLVIVEEAFGRVQDFGPGYA